MSEGCNRWEENGKFRNEKGKLIFHSLQTGEITNFFFSSFFQCRIKITVVSFLFFFPSLINVSTNVLRNKNYIRVVCGEIFYLREDFECHDANYCDDTFHDLSKSIRAKIKSFPQFLFDKFSQFQQWSLLRSLNLNFNFHQIFHFNLKVAFL